MKRLLTVLTLALGAAGPVTAQAPGMPAMPYGPGYGYGVQPGMTGAGPSDGQPYGMEGMQGNGAADGQQPPAKSKPYGWHPIFGKIFGSKGCTDCKDGKGSGYFKKAHVKPEPLPPPQGGTLVFPHHPYIRSPRDYFMED